MSESGGRDWIECPTCAGRPWTLWDWAPDGSPVWCPECGGSGLRVLPAADVPYIVTDDDEES